MLQQVYYDYIKFREHSFILGATEQGLSYIGLIPNQVEDIQRYYDKQKIAIELSHNEQKLLPYKNELCEYFAETRHYFTCPIDFGKAGTLLQQQVWQELQSIPYGETIPYSEVATRVNHPKAYRAIGTAIGKNPVPIVVPCHRVVKKNNDIGGYASGVELKKEFLQLEQNNGQK